MLRISSYKFRSRWNNLTTTVQSDVGVQIYGNLSYDKPKKKKKKVDIKLERKRSIMKYHVEGRGESDLKARILYRLCWRRRALKFLQNGQSSLRSIWTTTVSGHRVVSLTLPSMGGSLLFAGL